jgi:hypothetical protein
MTDESGELTLFYLPRWHRELERVRQSNTRFVHYTSADSALKILRSQRMLLRNSTLMNDFSEVQHGLSCLVAAYDGPHGDRLKKAMAAVQSDLPDIFQSNFNSLVSDVAQETYLISISEHGGGFEDQYGRLSMWRAYAPRNGVAFVLKNRPFLTETDALQAFSSPVLYATPETFEPAFGELADALENNLAQLIVGGGQWLHNYLMQAFRYAAQTTKHPAFAEEREWRVIYTPTILQRAGLLTPQQMERVPTEIMALGGVPQRVYAIPFRDYPDDDFHGATIPDLFERILIGPTQDAYTIAQAFVAELDVLGVPDPAERVLITGIPLRV